MTVREKIAAWIAPEYVAQIDDLNRRVESIEQDVSNRIADVLLKMDPYEPFLKKHNVIFSEEWEHPEDRLSEQSQIQLFQWAYGLETDPNWKYLTEWIRNTQGNATLRKAKNDNEWFYGRAAIITVELMLGEIRRLSSRYKELLESKGHTFDPHKILEE